MTADPVEQVRAFLKSSFAKHGIGEWLEPGVLYGFRIDAPSPDGRPRYWLAISVEALSDVGFDLAGQLTDQLADAMRSVGTSRQMVLVTKHGWKRRPVG